MAVTVGRQSWTNNAAYGSFVKSVLRHKDDAWAQSGPDEWYHSQNETYGAAQNFGPSSFKEKALYRNNEKKNSEFKVSRTTYHELGNFYGRPPPYKMYPRMSNSHPYQPLVHGPVIDASVQIDSAEIRRTMLGVAEQTQTIDEDFMRASPDLVPPRPPAKLPPLKQNLRVDDRRVRRSMPDISTLTDDDDSPPPSPMKRILRKLDDREKTDGTWHRYIDEKPRLVEDLRHKSVPNYRAPSRVDVADEPNYEIMTPPPAHSHDFGHQVPRPRRDVDENAFMKSHFYKSRNKPQPAVERTFVADEYGGESKWSNTSDYAIGKQPPARQLPIYADTPWPMKMTAPIDTPPTVGILPTGSRANEMTRYRDGAMTKRAIRELNDHHGNRALYVR